MITILFWAAAGLVLYVYVGYPLLLLLLRSIVGRKPPPPGDQQPHVTLVISAYNEAEIIGEKLANSAALDYPAARLEILVVSDASSDGTDAIVESATDTRVRLLRMRERGGKTLGLNEAARVASGEILVFSDANAMYLRDALRMLVRGFADPQVGAVVGESTYAESTAGADREESLYWRYEVTIKELESAIGSVVGGDGAIYAIRRDLYRPMRADALSDFVNPLQIVASGHRCVYEPAARSVEEAAGDFGREFRRKVRIVNRAWRATMTMARLLNPLRYGFFAVQLLSHKLLRWLVPAFLLIVLATNLALLQSGWIYVIALAAQLVLYALAALGYAWRRRSRVPRIVAVPFYFVMVNYASALGILDAYRGKTYTTWTTARAGGP
ncbi:MAG TPA: glycosyltransferase family 2 protein [Steroidobacteraceae bacterium]|jgi:cellulose synthase/poly-beta-1,6-N-acetylglucosamine synthase-like glycosyltransferase